MNAFTRTAQAHQAAGPTLRTPPMRPVHPLRQAAHLALGITALLACYAAAYWFGVQFLRPWVIELQAPAVPSWVQAAPAATSAPAQPLELRRPAISPTVRAAVWQDDRVLVSAGESVALPAGTRFQVELRATRSGPVRIEAVNPDGSTSLVWQTHLQAGERSLSPMLRLAGARGMETLRVISGRGHVQEVRILHV